MRSRFTAPVAALALLAAAGPGRLLGRRLGRGGAAHRAGDEHGIRWHGIRQR